MTERVNFRWRRTGALFLNAFSARVDAGRADPQVGYASVHTQLLDHANFGLCNAIGTLGNLILLSGGSVPALVTSAKAAECSALGVDLPPDIVEPSCVPAGQCTDTPEKCCTLDFIEFGCPDNPSLHLCFSF